MALEFAAEKVNEKMKKISKEKQPQKKKDSRYFMEGHRK